MCVPNRILNWCPRSWPTTAARKPRCCTKEICLVLSFKQASSTLCSEDAEWGQFTLSQDPCGFIVPHTDLGHETSSSTLTKKAHQSVRPETLGPDCEPRLPNCHTTIEMMQQSLQICHGEFQHRCGMKLWKSFHATAIQLDHGRNAWLMFQWNQTWWWAWINIWPWKQKLFMENLPTKDMETVQKQPKHNSLTRREQVGVQMF